EANLGLIQTNKYYEVAKCVTQDANLWPFPAAVVINKAQWDALSSQEQGWLRDAGAKLADDSLAVFTNPAPNAPNFASLLCGEGLTFAFAGKANQAAFANATKPAYTQLEKDPEVAAAIGKIRRSRRRRRHRRHRHRCRPAARPSRRPSHRSSPRPE